VHYARCAGSHARKPAARREATLTRVARAQECSHLANISQSVDASAHRIAVSGALNSALSLSLDDLAKMPAVDAAAVN
jgi:DMSO/TMAO reductase YedYZ molybdopterin-dependent catalytic subunit